MLWPSAALRVVLLLVTGYVGPPGVRADGLVGCLFSDRLCEEGVEICYDDFAFGRCVENDARQVDDADLYQYTLDKDTLHDLSQELRRLFALGYRWSHAYTQCRLQAMLYAAKNDIPLDTNSCTHLVDQDLEGALQALEGEDSIDPREVAIVKYTPSIADPHASYADEVYFPPITHDQATSARNIILPSNAVDIMDMADPYADYLVNKRTWIPQMHRRSEIFSPNYNTPGNFRSGLEIRDDLDFLPTSDSYYNDRQPRQQNDNEDDLGLTLDELERLKPIVDFFDKIGVGKHELKMLLLPQNNDHLQELLELYDLYERENNNNLEDQDADDEEPPERFSPSYNTPDNFRAGFESRDDMPEPRVYYEDEQTTYADEPPEEYGSGIQAEPAEVFRELKKMRTNYFKSPKSQEIFRELKNLQKHEEEQSSDAGIYTEGGIVYSKAPENSAGQEEVDAITELLDYDLGFQRPERLDVKKPGPLFDVQIHKQNPVEVQKLQDLLKPPMMKKEPRGAHPSQAAIKDVDTDYAYVGIRTSLETWQQGDDVVRKISSLLGLEPHVFKNIRVDRNEVSFQVNPNNRQGLNATEISNRIWDINDKLKSETGVEIFETGIGDKVKKPTVVRSLPETLTEFHIILFTICGILLALIIALSALLVIRRHVSRMEKIQGLTRPDSEASKDYQDLCRARMAAKGQEGGGGNGSQGVHGRITSLSRESEHSPSSRSSTSSWTEEPALHNMDISTGHMVLTYMEDHLQNKDRLEQEWIALCSYVAEPSETSIALKKENSGKNRYQDILPYDHARVVLNELSNMTGNNFINASSITDHDPRNPAYIATQGPLPQTAADFWQLIWEQGSVVIVMLTRLTEGGAAMCHRYWPEEGSEIYHIYEVHLVSEHIWCDDYLVRSFYLKNTRTGETRTVTQFHFLSWPDSGVPASTKALLEFRRKVNKSYRGRSCPIVVHCSDGAGRTGTYCLIDMVLSRMAKGAKEIDIAATLEHLRDQRARMVATRQQFEFVLTAVAEEVHAILKALPPQPTPSTANAQPDKEKDKEQK